MLSMSVAMSRESSMSTSSRSRIQRWAAKAHRCSGFAVPAIEDLAVAAELSAQLRENALPGEVVREVQFTGIARWIEVVRCGRAADTVAVGRYRASPRHVQDGRWGQSAAVDFDRLQLDAKARAHGARPRDGWLGLRPDDACGVSYLLTIAEQHRQPARVAFTVSQRVDCAETQRDRQPASAGACPENDEC